MNGKSIQDLSPTARGAALGASPLTLLVLRGDQQVELRLALDAVKAKK